MLPKSCDQTLANRFGEVSPIAHRIAGIGINQVHDGRLMLCIIQISFDDGDILHVRSPSRRSSMPPPGGAWVSFRILPFRGNGRRAIEWHVDDRSLAETKLTRQALLHEFIPPIEVRAE